MMTDGGAVSTELISAMKFADILRMQIRQMACKARVMVKAKPKEP